MRNVWLIAHREYVERIRTKLSLYAHHDHDPADHGRICFREVFFWVQRRPNEVHIAVVSPDTQLVLDLQAELERLHRNDSSAAEPEKHPTKSARGQQAAEHLCRRDESGARDAGDMDRKLDDNDLDGYLWITPAAMPGGRPLFSYTPRSSGQTSVRNILASALQRVLLREQLAHQGVVAEEADRMLQPVTVVTATISQRRSRVGGDQRLGAVLCDVPGDMLYGMNVARSIIEEKTSRIFEVLLATVRPEAMMAGKIIGVGSVGLTQVGIWLTAALALAGTSVAVHLGGDTIHMSLTFGQVISSSSTSFWGICFMHRLRRLWER